MCAHSNTTILYIAVPQATGGNRNNQKQRGEKQTSHAHRKKKKWWENRADELGE